MSQIKFTTAMVTCVVAAILAAFAFPHQKCINNMQHDISRRQMRNVHDEFDLFHHLGGNGPWVRRTEDIATDDISPPPGCYVNQVHMLARHDARYPTTRIGNKMLRLLERLQHSNITLTGDLAFIKNYTFFTAFPARDFDQLSTTGPHAGSLNAFSTGVKLRSRYSHLLPSSSDPTSMRKPIRFWASDSKRVIDTANYFALGFFGLNWTSSASLEVIPESPDRGADTLTPGRTCTMFIADKERGHDQGVIKLKEFGQTYLPAISRRLRPFITAQPASPEAQQNAPSLTEEDVYTLQELCTFEISLVGISRFCDLFSTDDFKDFEYARDILHFYRSGPGTPYSAAMGSLYLSAVAKLLGTQKKVGGVFASFVHDGDISPFLTALGVLAARWPEAGEQYLLTSMRDEDRKWRVSHVTPMGGRIILERLICSVNGENDDQSEHGHAFLRININDGIVALRDCASGPGLSCPLEEFLRRTWRRIEEAGNFGRVCGIDDESRHREEAVGESVAEGLSFFF